MRILSMLGMVAAFALNCLADSGETTSLRPMPGAEAIRRRGEVGGPFEELRFKLPLSCPESGEAITFYRRTLRDAGYKLATSPTAKWVYLQDHEKGVNAHVYKAVFCNNQRKEILTLEVSCPVEHRSAGGVVENVSVVIHGDRPLNELEQLYNVNCSYAP